MTTSTGVLGQSSGSWVAVALAWVARNLLTLSGLGLIAAVLLFALVGRAFVDISLAQVGSAPLNAPPSHAHLLGTNAQGRDMLAWLIQSTPASLRIGLLAGAVGTAIGTIVAFIGGYYGGWIDNVLRGATDVILTIPGFLVLVVIASMLQSISIDMMAFIIAALAWMAPARIIRSQVLSLRERQFVEVAKLSGASDWRIIFLELLPNLMPFLLAAFISAVAQAILAEIGLEVLGLGPSHLATLGNMIYGAEFYNALLRGMWWWWGPPIVVLVILFVGLFLTSVAMDEWANPRLRTRA